MTEKYITIANIYLDAFRQNGEKDEIMGIVEKILVDPLEGFMLIDALISLAANDGEIAYIAAGPFEDLFIKRYEAIFSPLDELLRKNIKMRKALTGIWIGENTLPRKALDQLLNKYNLKYGSL